MQDWQTSYLVPTPKRPPPKPPPLGRVTRRLAQLGGVLAGTGEGAPGVETIWRGYRELMGALPTLTLARAVGL